MRFDSLVILGWNDSITACTSILISAQVKDQKGDAVGASSNQYSRPSQFQHDNASKLCLNTWKMNEGQPDKCPPMHNCVNETIHA